MSKHNVSVTKTSQTSLVEWLKLVVTTLAIHTRAEWGHVLGVTPQAIGTWLSGEKLPRPETLRDLLSTLGRQYAERARPALLAWETLARQPFHEAWPGDARTDAPTLGHYVVGPLWDDLRLAVESQPPDVQASLLQRFIEEVNRQRLGERTRRIDRRVTPDERTIRNVAPNATQANPALISLMSSMIERGSMLPFSELSATI